MRRLVTFALVAGVVFGAGTWWVFDGDVEAAVRPVWGRVAP